MAFVDRIWVHSPHKNSNKMSVYVKLSPAGEVCIPVEVPQEFYDCLLRMAQTAADHHEQKMRAQILAEGGENGHSER